MNITCAYSFLVHPAKLLKEQPVIGGTSVPLRGKLFRMLSDLFERSDKECRIDICFKPNDDGTQQNDCRNEIIAFLKTPSMGLARVLATRLQSVTTNKSGLGLLFILLGEEKARKKICISRFPADIGILAEEDHTTLRVEFLEKVFMRNALSYKAAVYEGKSMDVDFWVGKAIDRQTNNKNIDICNYWICDFLRSDFFTTPASGTKRLANALYGALNKTDNLQIKDEIISSARLVRNLEGNTTTINGFIKRFSLSDETRDAVLREIPESLRFERFQFTREVFDKFLPFQSVELNNQVILTAPVNDFDEVIKRRVVDHNKKPEIYEFKTHGSIINEKLRRRK